MIGPMLMATLWIGGLAALGGGGPASPPQRSDDAGGPDAHQALVCPMCSHARRALRDLPPPPQFQDGIAGGAVDSTDVLHYTLDLEIVPSTVTLSGSNVMTVRSLQDGLSAFDFWLHSAFTITSVQVNGQSAAWQRLSTQVVRATLDPPVALDQVFDVRVQYSGTPVSGGFGSITFTSQGGQPLVFSLSEPWYAYTWWPVKESNADKATADLWFTVPDPMVVASNGLLQGVDALSGSRSRYRWRTQYQTAPYLFSFSATNYNQFGSTWAYGGITMPLQFFIYPGSDSPGNRAAWLASGGMLSVFSDLFDLYPFTQEKYGIYQFGFGGGMEHQTMTGQGGFTSSLTSHELAHQWWGDNVTCADWHHIWLNEGFATYSEALWLEFQPGSSGTPALLSAMAARRPTSFNVTVYRQDISTTGVIFSTNAVYRKGGWVLHMLRHVMGDQAFFQALREYRAAREPGVATTEDLQAVAEQVHGADLEWFFQPWVYQPGAPTYQLAWRPVSATGREYVELYLQQTQSASWPTYRMPIDVKVVMQAPPGGSQTHRVWSDERAEHLLFEVSSVPASIELDPDNYILRGQTTAGAFVEGPPKIVDAFPLPGAALSADDASAAPPLTVTFQVNVNPLASHFTLTGSASGDIPVSMSYSSATKTVTLQPSRALEPDGYTLLISDMLQGATSGLQLDGELAHLEGGPALPSGDGLPGGSAVVQFEVQAPRCVADIAPDGGDGVVNFDDILVVLANWGPCPSRRCVADVNGDGVVDFDDVLAILTAWGGC